MRASWNKLGDAAFDSGRLNFSLSDGVLETLFQRASRPSTALLVWLHGTVHRARKELPAFTGPLKRFAQVAHQIAVSDPTLPRHPNLHTAWYVGDAGLNVQEELSAFFARLAKTLRVSRVVYIGGSAGGFASLYFSLRHAGSCAIAVQPQTNLEYFDYSQQYVEQCWPGKTLAELEPQVCTNLCTAYAKGYKNAVVYIQGIGDQAHFRHHLTPFQYAVREQLATAVFHVDFWGHLGHARVPKQVSLAWIDAALAAESLRTTDLLMAHHGARLDGKDMPHPPSPPAHSHRPAPRPQTGFPGADIVIADSLRDFHLAKGA